MEEEKKNPNNNKTSEHIKIWKEINALQEQIGELAYLRSLDAQWIKEQKDLNSAKGDNNRRDWDRLRMQLKDQVLKERYGMNYKDVKHFSRFKSDPEAYRLMRSTVKQYPSEVKLHKGRGSAKGIEMIVARRV